jgi:hypothetical protein
LTSDISYKKRYLEARSKLREKEREIENLKQQKFFLPTVKFEDLSSHEKAIIEYVKENPGCKKQDIIDNIKAGAYITTRKIIEKLIQDGMIRYEKINNQYYKLYYNEKSIILQTYDELNKIRDYFSSIIYKIAENPLKYNLDKKISNPITSNIISIYVHILGMYIIYSLLKWSKEIDDITTLNRTYSLVFYELLEIQREISKSFKIKDKLPFKKATAGEVFSPLYHKLTPRFFILDPEKILDILKEFNKYENLDEIKDLLRLVWKISFPIYRYSNFDMIANPPTNVYDLENLVIALKYYTDKNNKNNDPTIKKLLHELENQ